MHMRPLNTLVLLIAFAAAAPAQLRQIAMIEIPGQPGFDAAVFVDKYLVIAHSSTNTLDIFDPIKRRVVAQVKDLSDPRGMAVDAGNARLYVANAGNSSIAVISCKSWQVEDTIKLPMAADSLLLVPARKALYASNRNQETISVVELANPAQISSVPLEGAPQSMVFDPAQNLVFASLQGRAEVVALDANNAIARHFRLNASQPTGLAFDPQAQKLYVAVRSAVLVLDPDDGREVARIPSANGTDNLWFDQATHRLFAISADGYVNVIKSQDGKYASEDELRTEVRGHALAFDPARNFVYLPGGREGHSKLVILRRAVGPDRSGIQEADKPVNQVTGEQVAQRK
ncbi:MAG TPA: YncE family protein [Terriglobales bacterium]|nr:YncE family protein [Terriglobales bacterium]